MQESKSIASSHPLSVQRAFTLIELLITIGIIAVLASLLLPAVKGALLKGKSAVDAGNLRTIAQANINYSADNEQRCVIGYTAVPGGLSKTWYSELRPYIDKGVDSSTNREGNVKALISPNDPSKGGITGPNAVTADSFARRSYAINYYTREFVSGSNQEYRGRRMISMPVGKMIFMCDYPAVAANTHGVSPNADTSLAFLPRTWHSLPDMAQFAFLDGHVEMIDVDDLLTTGSRYVEAWGPLPDTVTR